ncbi:hypothetical protein [Lacticaseibacillus sp. GG6-2]
MIELKGHGCRYVESYFRQQNRTCTTSWRPVLRLTVTSPGLTLLSMIAMVCSMCRP